MFNRSPHYMQQHSSISVAKQNPSINPTYEHHRDLLLVPSSEFPCGPSRESSRPSTSRYIILHHKTEALTQVLFSIKCHTKAYNEAIRLQILKQLHSQLCWKYQSRGTA